MSELEPTPVVGPAARIRESMRPALTKSQVLAGLLCALLGFALVVQVRAGAQDQLANLRQEDLVRLLDEVSTRADQLADEVSRLQATRDELASGTGAAQAALEIARQRAATEGILSGRLPAEGPGVIITITGARLLHAADLFNVLEELRNAGAEAVQVEQVRITTSSAFVDTASGIMLDNHLLGERVEWRVIGDPATLDRALEIPGGALPSVRTEGATADAVQEESVLVEATVPLREPRYARPIMEQ